MAGDTQNEHIKIHRVTSQTSSGLSERIRAKPRTGMHVPHTGQYSFRQMNFLLMVYWRRLRDLTEVCITIILAPEWKSKVYLE